MAAGKTAAAIHYDITGFANLATSVVCEELWGMALVALSWCGALAPVNQSSHHFPSHNGLSPA